MVRGFETFETFETLSKYCHFKIGIHYRRGAALHIIFAALHFHFFSPRAWGYAAPLTPGLGFYYIPIPLTGARRCSAISAAPRG